MLNENKYPLNLTTVQVSLDPASKAFGVAVFSSKGEFIDSFTVNVSEGIIPTMRLYFIRKKFIEEWEKRYGINCIANLAVIEHLPPGNSAILQNAGGAILSSGKISASLEYSDFITPSMWKAFCKDLGCRDKQPKGVPALKSIGWEYSLPTSEDEADAILLYLCSRWRKKQHIYLGKNKWMESFYQPRKWAPKKKRVAKK